MPLGGMVISHVNVDTIPISITLLMMKRTVVQDVANAIAMH